MKSVIFIKDKVEKYIIGSDFEPIVNITISRSRCETENGYYPIINYNIVMILYRARKNDRDLHDGAETQPVSSLIQRIILLYCFKSSPQMKRLQFSLLRVIK